MGIVFICGVVVTVPPVVVVTVVCAKAGTPARAKAIPIHFICPYVILCPFKSFDLCGHLRFYRIESSTQQARLGYA